MNLSWMNAVGTVEWTAEGDAPERLLTKIRNAPIPCWDFHYKNEGDGVRLTAVCFARDYAKLRPLVRHTGLRVRVVKKRGWPFRLRPLRKHRGLLIGTAVSAVLLGWMTGQIWVVELPASLSPEKAAVIRDFLATQGVAISQPIASLHPNEIELEALTHVPDIASLSVNMDGCIARVEVVERTLTESLKPPDIRLSNIVAARDGHILSMTVLSGQQQVKSGCGVVQGTLLISGVVENNVGLFLRRSQGVVMAETKRTLTVEVPYTQTICRPSGEVRRQTTLSLFGWPIPLYTPLSVPPNASATEGRQTATLFGTDLPLSLTRKEIALQTTVTVTYSKTEAEQIALKQLSDLEKAELKGATIQTRTLKKQAETDRYRLVADYGCIEDIAREVPIRVHESENE